MDDNSLKMSFCTEFLPRSSLHALNLPPPQQLLKPIFSHTNLLSTNHHTKKDAHAPHARPSTIFYSAPSQISVCSLFIFRPITTITAVNMIPIMIAGTVLSTPNPTL